MFNDSLRCRSTAFRILELSALLAASIAAGCAGGTSYGGGGGGGGTPSLAAAVASVGSFSSGEQGASYTITVSNTGTAATSGTVTVADPPTGFVVTAMSGTNWMCTLATPMTTCTTTYSVAAGQSFPPITVTGNVTSAVGTPVTIPLTLSGGGAPTVNVTPMPSVTVAAAALSITKTHTGNFTQGQVGATYQVIVSNNAGGGATDGSTVVVTDTPQAGLTVTAIAGTGWTRLGGAGANTVVRSDILQPGSSYPPITVTVKVSPGAASPEFNSVKVTGGGSALGITTDHATILSSTAPACPLSKLGNESLLNGTYVVALNGWEDGVGPSQGIGAFAADGTGSFTKGELDSSNVAVGTLQSTPVLETMGGCYQVGLDFHGLMIWNFSGGGTEAFAFAISSDGTFADIMEFDDQDPGTSPGVRASGDFNIETGGPFTLASFSGPFAFEAKGYSPNAGNTDYLRERKIGRFDDSISGVVMNGAADVGIATGTGTQSNVDNQSFTGNLTAPDSLGRGTATFIYPNFNNAGALTLHFAYYLNDASDFVMVSTDTPDSSGHAMDHGFATTQLNGPYGLGSLNGNGVLSMVGADLSVNHGFTVTGVAQVTGDGHGGASARLDEVSNGSVVVTGTNNIPGGSFVVSANGMGVLTIGSGGAARKFSIAMYDQNSGMLLEGTAASPGGNVLTGELRSQIAPTGGFVDSTFSGAYIVGTNRQASPNSTFEVGFVTTPTVQTNPPNFSGNIDLSNGSGCNTGCLSSNQAVSATFHVDANGRITIIPTGGGGPSVGWFTRKGNGFWLISDTGDANGTILN